MEYSNITIFMNTYHYLYVINYKYIDILDLQGVKDERNNGPELLYMN